jgi:hypothetical protein
VGNPLSSRLVRELKAAKKDVWQQQCEVVQRLGRNRFEVGFTTEEGNEALIAAGLPTLNGEQMKRALTQCGYLIRSFLKHEHRGVPASRARPHLRCFFHAPATGKPAGNR